MDRRARREHFAAILAAICTAPGHLSVAARRAAAEGTNESGALSPALAGLAEKIRSGAQAVTDEDIARAREGGHDDDELFELTVATALGASSRRLDAALRALGRKE